MDFAKRFHQFTQLTIILAIIGIFLAVLVPNLRRSTTTERIDSCCSLCGARTIRAMEKGVASITSPQMLQAIAPFDHQHVWVSDGKVVRESIFGSESYDAHGPRLFVVMLELQTFFELVGGKKNDSRLQDFYLRQVSKLSDPQHFIAIELLRRSIIDHERFRGLKSITSESEFWEALTAIDKEVLPTRKAESGAF